MRADLIAKLEARLKELKSKDFSEFSEPHKTAMEMSNNMLIEEIEERLTELKKAGCELKFG